MKRKQSLIGGLDRILSVREASDLLSIPVEELLKFYAGQREISLSNLLKRICRSNPIYHFPIIGEPTYTLKGVMNATGKGRSWSLFFLERNCVRTLCVGVHYLYAKVDVDNAWRKESIMWDEWIPLLQVPGVYGLDIRVVLQQLVQVRRCHRCIHDGIQGISSEVNESRWQPSLCPKHSLRLPQEHQEAIANRLR